MREVVSKLKGGSVNLSTLLFIELHANLSLWYMRLDCDPEWLLFEGKARWIFSVVCIVPVSFCGS